MKKIGKGKVQYKASDGKTYTGPAYGTHEWTEKAKNLALSWAPEILACKHCDQPVIEGYCCTACGSSSPR